MHVQFRWPRSALLVFAACAALVLTLLPPAAAQATPVWGTDGGGGTSPEAKIEAKLAQQFDQSSGQPQDFWVMFDAKPDLSPAYGIEDWTARGEFVVRELKRAADTAQADTIDELQASGVEYESYWIANAIHVTNGSHQLAMSLAVRPGVAQLLAPVTYELPEPVESSTDDQMAPASVEWGLQNINADDVWADGIDGGGIVVASIDTGAQFNHPALVKQYRGNNGDGTFSHDYNWFDAASACGGAPCDEQHWHGTHVTGTMVGDDGGDNQIGVAPGATWIAANGCVTCSATHLIRSGEWMLAPTKLDGTDPDPSKRPHIINNSWGTQSPSNDPFADAVWEAWTASGIFGVFANGNMGPACATSGAPGSRTAIYSVGAYDINNQIASFSSRGPGQDGTIKPDIAAPGANVRSSTPGGRYGVASGTSMASPHVAGAIALLWSAIPGLVGDIEATRDLLDSTAIDTANLQCGGDEGNNNVFGEGRLDALALVDGHSVGILAGKVTDQAGAPITSARVTISGEVGERLIDRTVHAGDDGHYRSGLPAGEYEVSASAYGYVEQETTATVTEGVTTTVDFVLPAAPMATVSGQVTDGSGQGWPLYAEITVPGEPLAGAQWTDPFTGRYRFTLPQDASHTLRVESRLPGYQSTDVLVDVGDSDQQRDIALTVDQGNCTAPGYHWEYDSPPQQFTGWTGTDPQDDWTIVDHNGSGLTWTFDNVRDRPAPPGSDGDLAILDAGRNPRQNHDTSLVSPVIDLSDQATPHVSFDSYFRGATFSSADVDLSLDGGASWSNLWRQTASAVVVGHVDIPVPQAAGQSGVQVRFHIRARSNFWAIDNVTLGAAPRCVPSSGGLVAGLVRDDNTGDGVYDARVTNGDAPGESALSVATEGDPNVGGGYYWLFSSLTGPRPFSVAKNHYATEATTVEVLAGSLTRQDFALGAGRLTITPGSVEQTAQMGDAPKSQTVVFGNDGAKPVRVKLSEQHGGVAPMAGFQAPGTGAPLRLVEGDFSPAAAFRQLTQPSAVSPPQFTRNTTPSEGPWTDVADLPQPAMMSMVTHHNGKVYSVGGSSGGDLEPTRAGYVYDPLEQAWSRIADLPEPRRLAPAAFVNGTMYVIGGSSTASLDLVDDVFAYDPVADTWSRRASIPRALWFSGVAVADDQIYAIAGCEWQAVSCIPQQTVLRYSPSVDSWTRVADYPVGATYAACGGVADGIVCAGGIDETGNMVSTTYRYHPTTDRWTRVADMPYDSYAAATSAANGKLQVMAGATLGGTAITNQAVEYDPTTDTWSALPNANHAVWHARATCGIYKIGGSAERTGLAPLPTVEVLPGYNQCNDAGSDVPWLSVDTTSFEVEPGETVRVRVTLDNAPLGQPGDYTSALRVTANTPYHVRPIDVTLQLDPPRHWGKLNGTVTDAGTGDAIAGAMVHIEEGAGKGATSFTLKTDEHGYYQLWLDTRGGPKQVIFAKDDYIAQVERVKLAAGETTTVDVALVRWSAFSLRQPI